jgi:hypothetical protein
MREIAIFLACTSCIAQGRRVQTVVDRIQHNKEQKIGVDTDSHARVNDTMTAHEDAFPIDSGKPSSLSQTAQEKVAPKKNHFVELLKQVASNDEERAFLRLGIGVALLGCVGMCSCGILTQVGLAKVFKNQTRNKFKFKGRVIYEWDQDDTFVRIYIKPPHGIGENSIETRIWPRHIIVRKKGNPPFIKDELYTAIDDQASSSAFVKGELQILLRKVEQIEWPCVLMSHLPKTSVKG